MIHAVIPWSRTHTMSETAKGKMFNGSAWLPSKLYVYFGMLLVIRVSWTCGIEAYLNSTVLSKLEMNFCYMIICTYCH